MRYIYEGIKITKNIREKLGDNDLRLLETLYDMSNQN